MAHDTALGVDQAVVRELRALLALFVQQRQLHPLVDSSVCFVGAVLALASGKAERRQLHPLGG